MKAKVSIGAILTTIKRHNLRPVDGAYHFTDKMIDEAIDLDAAEGGNPCSMELLKAAMTKGRPRHATTTPITILMEPGKPWDHDELMSAWFDDYKALLH